VKRRHGHLYDALKRRPSAGGSRSARGQCQRSTCRVATLRASCAHSRSCRPEYTERPHPPSWVGVRSGIRFRVGEGKESARTHQCIPRPSMSALTVLVSIGGGAPSPPAMSVGAVRREIVYDVGRNDGCGMLISPAGSRAGRCQQAGLGREGATSSDPHPLTLGSSPRSDSSRSRCWWCRWPARPRRPSS
jgi:hypothetical protein